MSRRQSLDAQVVVVGGGVAGVCAALAAARHGAATVLIQDRPVLGGNSSSEIRVHVTGADCSGGRPGFREGGLLEELRLEEAVRNPERNACLWDLVLWEKVKAEPHLRLLLNTTCGAVEKVGDRLATVVAQQLTTETEYRVTADYFVDCTGHGRLGYLAGADYALGREGPDEYGEAQAQGPDGQTMGASLMWCARDVGHPVTFTPPAWARKFTRPENLPYRLGDGSLEYGPWWIEYGGELDIIQAGEEIRDELIACLMGVWDYYKNHSGMEVANWDLTWWGFLPGHRESRRLLGPHVLTASDLLEGQEFADAIGHGGWPIDTHPPAGIHSPDPPCHFLDAPEVYAIPLRSLYSRNVPNLFMAGRDASCTHLAMASTRVMGTCAAMGQAAGTAAACCANQGCRPGELSPGQVSAIQQALLRDDQFIPGVPGADPADLARQAAVSVSSRAEGYPGEAVLDGWTRELDGQAHQWRSAPGEPLPQHLELTWPQPMPVREVRLTFDTGFERPLGLTHSDQLTAKTVRGPQPETVRDYDLLGRVAGEWRPLVQERGNYRRQRVHAVAAPELEALRLVVGATNGVPEARVFEVRVY
ncbi:MAG TPA: FAD-dependent oxidoreductase [Armatimonadota bacterium]|jgi:hypothetical protein